LRPNLATVPLILTFIGKLTDPWLELKLSKREAIFLGLISRLKFRGIISPFSMGLQGAAVN